MGISAIILFAVAAEAFAPSQAARARVVAPVHAAQPRMVLGYKLKLAAGGVVVGGAVFAVRKLTESRDAAAAKVGRAALAGMSQMADLKDLKIEREEGKEGRPLTWEPAKSAAVVDGLALLSVQHRPCRMAS